MNLKKINFPVYLVTKPVSREGTALVFLNAEEELEYLDDLSIPFESLGMRRLHIPHKLVPLTNAIYFIKDMVKLTLGETQFIDSKGYLFKYSKTRMVPLVFKRITKIIPIKTGGAILEIDNEYPRYKIMYAPNPDEKFVGLLRVSAKAYTVYGLYTELYEDTRRKI